MIQLGSYIKFVPYHAKDFVVGKVIYYKSKSRWGDSLILNNSVLPEHISFNIDRTSEITEGEAMLYQLENA